MASELLQSISRDEDERARFRSCRKFETDLESNIRTNYLNGLSEGLARGRAEGKIEMIRRMLINGMGAKEIQIFSGLSIAEIEKIKSQL